MLAPGPSWSSLLQPDSALPGFRGKLVAFLGAPLRFRLALPTPSDPDHAREMERALQDALRFLRARLRAHGAGLGPLRAASRDLQGLVDGLSNFPAARGMLRPGPVFPPGHLGSGPPNWTGTATRPCYVVAVAIRDFQLARSLPAWRQGDLLGNQLSMRQGDVLGLFWQRMVPYATDGFYRFTGCSPWKCNFKDWTYGLGAAPDAAGFFPGACAVCVPETLGAVAVHAFEADPGARHCLSLARGDFVEGLHPPSAGGGWRGPQAAGGLHHDASGWSYGQVRGRAGWFPLSHVQEQRRGPPDPGHVSLPAAAGPFPAPVFDLVDSDGQPYRG